MKVSKAAPGFNGDAFEKLACLAARARRQHGVMALIQDGDFASCRERRLVDCRVQVVTTVTERAA
jgi:hypothetical protein